MLTDTDQTWPSRRVWGLVAAELGGDDENHGSLSGGINAWPAAGVLDAGARRIVVVRTITWLSSVRRPRRRRAAAGNPPSSEGADPRRPAYTRGKPRPRSTDGARQPLPGSIAPRPSGTIAGNGAMGTAGRGESGM